jgi:Na+-driven multidrug efflux pump
VALQSGLNCAGNIYLICHCRMGIAAAAWASVASQYVGMVGLAAALQHTPVSCQQAAALQLIALPLRTHSSCRLHACQDVFHALSR